MIRPRFPQLHTPLLVRAATLIGCALSLGPTTAAARTRVPVPPSRDARPAAAPWNEDRVVPGRVAHPSVRHPALHGDQEHAGRRLFPRAADDLSAAVARKGSMARHPAGKGIRADDACHHEVEQGDTLWGIADRITDGSAADVSKRTNSIYRANRGVIGPDPNLILPGQILSLREGCAR